MTTDAGREPDPAQPAEAAIEQSTPPAFAWDTPGAGWDEGDHVIEEVVTDAGL